MNHSVRRDSSNGLFAVLRERLVPGLLAGVAALFAFLPRTAHAQVSEPAPDAPQIRWQAPADCPDAAYLNAYIERLLARPIAALAAPRMIAQGSVQRESSGKWQLSLRIDMGDRTSEETLIARQCRALADAMALKLALIIDPLGVAGAVEPRRSVALSSNREPLASAAAQRSSPRARADGDSARVAVRLGGVAGLGYLPGVSRGASLYGSLALSSFRVELGGQVETGDDAYSSQVRSIGVHLALISGALRTCVETTRGPIALPLCAGLELGVMRGTGFGVPNPASASSLWAAALLSSGARVPLSQRWAVWIEVSALVDFIRPGFYMANLEGLYLAPRAGARGSAGFEFNFGP
jgi:hypothetical protein